MEKVFLMKNHVFLAVLLCALALPRVADAGELQQQWQQKKENWRAQWQEQQQSGGKAAAAVAAASELKEKYGQLSPQQAQALRERVQQAKEKYLSPEQRNERWEAFKAEHPDLVADMKGTEEERRKQWEDWKDGHTAASDQWRQKTDTARQKWEELKELQSGDTASEDRANWREFKFQNRDEGLDLRRKYNDWAKDNKDAANSLKTRALQWKATH